MIVLLSRRTICNASRSCIISACNQQVFTWTLLAVCSIETCLTICNIAHYTLSVDSIRCDCRTWRITKWRIEVVTIIAFRTISWITTEFTRNRTWDTIFCWAISIGTCRAVLGTFIIPTWTDIFWKNQIGTVKWARKIGSIVVEIVGAKKACWNSLGTG